MKIQIIGWFYIISAAIFFFSFLVNVLFPLLFSGGMVESFNQIWTGMLALLLGIYALVLGSAIKGYKKWAWYAGIATAGLAMISSLISLVVFSFGSLISLMIGILVSLFIIYALFLEKQAFFENQ